MSFTVLQFQEVFILLNGAFSCKPAVGIPLAVQNKVLRVRQAQWPLTGKKSTRIEFRADRARNSFNGISNQIELNTFFSTRVEVC